MTLNYKEHAEAINRKIKELVGMYRDTVKHLNISESEFWIWYTLVSIDGEHTQQDICTMWSLPKQTVNTVITQMRIKKYAYLEAKSGTRKHKTVRLTEEGKKYGEALVLPITLAEKKAFDKISTEEISLVTKVFGKYIEILRREFNATAT
ncbi:MAG: MarR family transcriptional regulator [Clostridia bacterium]|nr:MarR family transcriptional regulator [Clostridia bacterium]